MQRMIIDEVIKEIHLAFLDLMDSFHIHSFEDLSCLMHGFTLRFENEPIMTIKIDMSRLVDGDISTKESIECIAKHFYEVCKNRILLMPVPQEQIRQLAQMPMLMAKEDY